MLDLIDTKGKKDIKSMTLEEVTAEMTAPVSYTHLTLPTILLV